MPIFKRRISVALCTYNGAVHLHEQLGSIVHQSRLPDEVIIFDDASTDNTATILHHFAGQPNPFAVQVHINPQQIGVVKNFEQAISACTGEVIVLCDQDDQWLEEKLSLIDRAFDENPAAGFVFSDADMCDEQGRSLGYHLWDSVRFNAPLQRKIHRGHAFEVMVRQNMATGATMAFAARHRPLLLPIDPQWVHDGWIALLLAAIAPVVLIGQPTIRYRQHSRQAIGALQRTLYQQYLAAREMDRNVFARQAGMYQAALDRLLSLPPDSPVPPRVLNLLRKKIEHFQIRSAIRLRQRSRFLPSFAELLKLRYRHFSLGWKSFAQDLFL